MIRLCFYDKSAVQLTYIVHCRPPDMLLDQYRHFLRELDQNDHVPFANRKNLTLAPPPS